MKQSAANAGACVVLVSMKLAKACNRHGLVKGVKSKALGENTWITQYGNEKENRRLVVFVFEGVTAYSQGSDRPFSISSRM